MGVDTVRYPDNNYRKLVESAVSGIRAKDSQEWLAQEREKTDA
jgi:hypothetical protein